MKAFHRSRLALLALIFVAGCASSSVSNRQSSVGDERIARPDYIYVYDFAATAEDIAADGTNTDQYAAPSTTPSAEEVATGRKLGSEVATRLVAKIQAMGLQAAVATQDTKPAVGDIVIHGYFVSIEEGSAAKRIVVGFGSGNADLKTDVTGFLVTADGLRKLGSGEVDSGGGKTPGVLVPLAVTVATANPIGLLVGGAVKAEGEISGRDTIEGSAERTATEIATELQAAFKKQGWI